MTSSLPAVFGKLPAHGDFVARGLTEPARAAWDAWLSEGVAAARASWGDRFEDVYDAAPPWRFVLDPDPFCGGRSAGAVAPSADAVGRRYPLAVCVLEPAPETAEALAERCEQLIYAALSEGWTADRLFEALSDGSRNSDVSGEGRPGWWCEDAPGVRFATRPSYDALLVGSGETGA